MAVDTASKRSAGLSYGAAHRAGTRPPSGAVGAFDRGALLACYYLVVDAVPPEDGVVSPRMSRIVVGREDRGVVAAASSRVVWAKAREAVQ